MSSDGFRVNFSGEEAGATGQSSKLLPRGDYHVKVTDGSIEQVKSNEKGNQGKPFYNFELTVQEGEHAGRRLFDRAMLFNGALYTISQIMKAMGLQVHEGEMEVPSLAEIIGRDFIVGVRVKKETDEYDASNTIRSYMAYNAQTAAKAEGAKKNALMP
jgi:hypothetical protein